MLSLKDCKIDVISHNPNVKNLLLHMIKIHDHEGASTHASLASAVKKQGANTQKHLIFMDSPDTLSEIRFYSDKLENAKIFLIEGDQDAFRCSLAECLESLRILEKHVVHAEHLAFSPKNRIPWEKFDTTSKGNLSEKIDQTMNIQAFHIQIGSIPNPLTMRGFIKGVKSILDQSPSFYPSIKVKKEEK